MRIATEKTLSGQQGRADLNAFKEQFDKEMSSNLGSSYKNSLTPFEVWNPGKQSIESYLSQNKVSGNTIAYINKAVAQISNKSHGRFDKITSPSISDFSAMSSDIKAEMSILEREAFQDSNMSDTDKKVFVSVTTTVSNLSDELTNTCISYYQNADFGKAQLRSWFSSVCKIVVNAIVTAVIVAVAIVAVAAIVYFSGGTALFLGSTVAAGITTFGGFCIAAGVGTGIITGVGGAWGTCTGFCILDEDSGYRCFCK